MEAKKRIVRVEPVLKLREAAEEYIAEAHSILAPDALCDHSVGICWCDYQRSLFQLREAIANIYTQTK